MKTSAIMILIACLGSGSVVANEFTGNLSGSLGNKSLDNNDWDNVDSQGSLGFISDFKMKNWPVSVAVDGFLSIGDDTRDNEDNIEDLKDVDASTADLHLGVRKIWIIPGSKFSPYLGGGLALIRGSQEREVNGVKEDESDSAMGNWLGAGIYWRPTGKLNIGVDVRYSKANISLFERDIAAGGLQTGIFVGYHW